MNRSKLKFVLLGVLAIVFFGFYSLDIHLKPNLAKAFTLPDFAATTHIKSAKDKPLNNLKDFDDAIVDIADQVNPTVVTIRIKQTVKVPENPLFRFFGDPRGGETQKRLRRGVGSGVIVSKDGYILTNNHVVQDADEITVDLFNDKEYTGKVVGTDPQTDIAVVKIDADDLPAINMGNSDNLRVGEMVLAVGSPENLAHSVSMGIISAKGRTIGLIDHGKGYENYIQTDAAINPGNSGGALVNMDGKLVGINAAIASQSGGNEGIGFAVPIDLAKSIMESLIKNGKVSRSQLGIYGSDITQSLAQGLNLENRKGILVQSVLDDSPADKGGLKQGDVIKSIDGKAVKDYNRFRIRIANTKPGTEIKLGILRDGKSKDVDVTLAERNPQDESSGEGSNKDLQERLGFRVHPINSDIARQLDLEAGQQGVVVTNIDPSSNAAEEGLQRGDVITKVNKQAVKNVSDFEKLINKAAKKKDSVVLLQVLSKGVNRFIAFKL